MGVLAPPHLPDDITMRLNKELNAIIADPAVAARIHAMGSEPKGGTPADFKNRIATDIARWTKVVADAKIPRI
jgi:tripartite-type tricarboxylate transporter receptor subunit TctC